MIVPFTDEDMDIITRRISQSSFLAVLEERAYRIDLRRMMASEVFRERRWRVSGCMTVPADCVGMDIRGMDKLDLSAQGLRYEIEKLEGGPLV